jgi:hypothetical protein
MAIRQDDPILFDMSDDDRQRYMKKLYDALDARTSFRDQYKQAPAPDSVGTGEVMAQFDQGRNITVNIGDVGTFRISMTSDGQMRCQCGGVLDIERFLFSEEKIIPCDHLRSTLNIGRVFFEQDQFGSKYPVFAFSRGNGRVVAKPTDGARNTVVDVLASILENLGTGSFGTNARLRIEQAQKVITRLKTKGYIITLSEGNEGDLVQEQKSRMDLADRQKRIAEKAAQELAAERERQRIAEESANRTRWIQLDE